MPLSSIIRGLCYLSDSERKHDMKITQQEPIYDAMKLGKGRMAILGLQHMFAMFGATILVPILVNSYFKGEGLSVQVTLFFSGIG